jgi:hypothetical protein
MLPRHLLPIPTNAESLKSLKHSSCFGAVFQFVTQGFDVSLVPFCHTRMLHAASKRRLIGHSSFTHFHCCVDIPDHFCLPQNSQPREQSRMLLFLEQRQRTRPLSPAFEPRDNTKFIRTLSNTYSNHSYERDLQIFGKVLVCNSNPHSQTFS